MKHTAKQIQFQEFLKPDQQYTFIATIGNRVYARARSHDGAPVFVEQKYTPTYYIPTTEAGATHRAFDGRPLKAHQCESVSAGRQWVEQQPLPVYGNIQPEYMVLSDCYGAHDVQFDIDRLYIQKIDIEVDSEHGFAPVEDPFAEVTAITVSWWHMGEHGIVTYGCKDFNAPDDVFYVKCDTENEMLLRFLDDFRGGGDYPDIITGWNIEFYDIPYLVNRMKRLFTQETWIRWSPFQRLAERRVTLYGRDQQAIEIKGVAILDYYELYRKFTYTQQESYRLDHIAHVELKKRKVSYAEFKSLRNLYKLDYQKFMEYNIQDVKLVDELDQKLKLIDLVCSLAYNAKSNFVDCFRQVRLWDIMIYHKLRTQGKQVPPRQDARKADQFAGAYVKDPLVGQHDWVCSFDVASMYPHIIREWNLSPEMILGKVTNKLTVEDLLDRKIDTSSAIANGQAMAANGLLTRRDAEGFLPDMLKTLYDERVRFKDMMKAAKKELEHVKEEIRTHGETDALKLRAKELGKNISAYNNQQSVRKVNLNSAYGALGSPYFRFFDVDLAEAVTISGQLIIRWIAKDVNDYLNTSFGTHEDYIIASDTDSIYVRMSKFVEKLRTAFPSANKEFIINSIDRFCSLKIEPVLAKSFDALAQYLNVAIPCLTMKREVIADRGVWQAKKRYILNVFDNEGVRYDKPSLKMMGIEAIKSSTPAICRDMFAKVLTIFMNGTQEELWKFVADARTEFMKAPFEDIAFPRSCNGLANYAEGDKSIPIQIKGALAFNTAVEKLGDKYEPIRNGEKIRFAYLRQPNPFHTHVMSATHGCPSEWNIEKWLDYNTQFDKAFALPLEEILKCAGWHVEPVMALF